MDIIIITTFIIVAIILLLAEMFIIPGLSIAGILSGASFIYANYFAFTHLGATGGIITLFISIALCTGAVVWFMHSKTLDKVSLKKEIRSKIDTSEKDTVRIGDTGVTTTRLALIGYADIKGYIVEVKSMDGFIDEKSPIIVSRIGDGTIYVEKA